MSNKQTSANRKEIRVTGFGGQGVVLSAHIIGRACAINAKKHATMIQSFGPEARGSACSATLAICNTEVLYPYIGKTDVFVAMSSEGYGKYRNELKDDGTVIFEKDLVKPILKEGQPAFCIPSTRIAESLGRRIIQNIVMLGFITGVTQIVSREEMREAVKSSVPPGTEEINMQAFEAGLAYFDATYGENAKKEATAKKAS